MDAKITLSFDERIISRAKSLCDELGISLSRFTEIIYTKALEHGNAFTIEELPVSNWVLQVAEEQATYVTKRKNRKQLKNEFFESRK
jgi:antitoxin component of RelBE/YafQ-DinJ toxin-antitoxin module